MYYCKDDGFIVAYEHNYNGSRDYLIGNYLGARMEDVVYFRDHDGFWKRDLKSNDDEPIAFLNNMNLDCDAAVGFLEQYVIVENNTFHYDGIEIYDLFDYSGNRIESHYEEQFAEQVYKKLFFGGFGMRPLGIHDAEKYTQFIGDVIAEANKHDVGVIRAYCKQLKEEADSYENELLSDIEYYYFDILDNLTVEDITVAIYNIWRLEEMLFSELVKAHDLSVILGEESILAKKQIVNNRDVERSLLKQLRSKKGRTAFGANIMDFQYLCSYFDKRLGTDLSKHTTICQQSSSDSCLVQ